MPSEAKTMGQNRHLMPFLHGIFGVIIIISLYIYMGKLYYFTNLNSSAIWGWFPCKNHDSSEGEQWGRDEIYPD